MRKAYLLSLLALSSVLTLVGCKDEPLPPANLYLPENYYEVPKTAGNYNLPINIDQAFTVTSNQKWLTTSGSGEAMNGNYTFTVEENNESDVRIGYLTINSSGGVSEGVSIRQMRNNAVNTYSNSLYSNGGIKNIGSMGGEYKFAVLYGLDVNKNDVEYTIPQGNEWVSVEFIKARNNIDNPVDNLQDSVVVTVLPNDAGVADREVTITFSNDNYNGISDDIVFHQTAEPTFEMIRRNYDVAKDITSLSIELRANGGFNSITRSVDWITLPAQKDVFDNDYVIELEPNTSGLARTGTITFISSQNQELVATIYQMSQYTNKNETNKYEVSGVSRTFEIALLGEYNVNITENSNWISVEKRGLKAYITVLENPGAERKETITFTDANNASRSDEIELTQTSLPTFDIIDTKKVLPVYNDYTLGVEVNISHPFEIRNFSSTWLAVDLTDGDWSVEKPTSVSSPSLNGKFYIKPLEKTVTQENEEVIVRTGLLNIISEGVTKVIEVKQINKNIIDIPADTVGVGNDGGSFTYDIVDGITYTFEPIGAMPTWISFNKDAVNNTFTATVEKNNNSDIRSCSFEFIDAANSKRDTVDFVQYGATKIIDLANGRLSTQVSASEINHIYAIEIKGEMTTDDFTTLQGKNAQLGNFLRLATLDLSGITNIEIPDDAFAGFNNLSEVILPAGLTKIGARAFQNNAKLVSVNIPNTVTVLGEFAFNSCYALENIVLPSGITVLEQGVLRQTGVRSLIIPKGVATIKDNALSATPELLSVTFEAGSVLKEIGEYAFFACPKLGSIELPATLETIGAYAFSISRSLSYVGIKDTKVTSIPEACFSGTNMSTIELPSALKSIGFEAFARTPITDITIPADVTRIDESAFLDIVSMDSKEVVEITLLRYDTNANDVYSKITTFGQNLFSNSGPPEDKEKLVIYVPKGSLATYVSVVCTGQNNQDNRWGDEYVTIFKESID